MIGRLARGAYMLIVAGMIVAWAMSAGQKQPGRAQKPTKWSYSWWC